jgi:signal peptidase I
MSTVMKAPQRERHADVDASPPALSETPPRPDLPSRSARRRRPVRPARRSGEWVRRAPRRPRPLRFLRILLTWIPVGMVSALLVGLVVPAVFGFHNFLEMSGSMEPNLHVGDVVIDRSIAPLDVRIGDVITFRDPQDQTTLITHRVHGMHVHPGFVRFTTKGDAVNSVQRWNIPVNGHVGRVVAHIPRLGFALFWVSTRIGRLLLFVLPAVSLACLELVRIWRPKRKKIARDTTT